MNSLSHRLKGCFTDYMVRKDLVKRVSCPQGEFAELSVAHTLDKHSDVFSDWEGR